MQEESDKLLEIIKSSEHGPKKWKQIAKALNSATGGQKTPSQCCKPLLDYKIINLIMFIAQHYHRVAAPGINKGTWTKGTDCRIGD